MKRDDLHNGKKKIIEYKVGLIKQIDSLQKNNLVCGHKEFIEECKYCWSNCDLEIIKTIVRG
ncbi:hypothetical protein SHM_22910 [Spiroplasma ixodetis]|uniref:Uncharacterized protein n=1 Tax=Spiroplasma ixodetis TaxID=2141 RepID=A0ABN6T6A4_9MOLU|nr:hypothetical protein SHM_22910 [Spiroplasma ixodetis]